jgi:hypothetical protein
MKISICGENCSISGNGSYTKSRSVLTIASSGARHQIFTMEVHSSPLRLPRVTDSAQ